MTDAGARLAAILDGIGARDVLDIGCGGGGLARDLAARGHVVTGIDPAPQAIAAALERVPAARFVIGGAEALPFRDASFDACVFLNSLHHVPVAHMPAALRAARRVLRPGGEVVIVEPLAQGAYFEVMRPIDDETTIRRAAIAAIDAVMGTGEATGPAPVTWERPTPVADVEALIDTLPASIPPAAPSPKPGATKSPAFSPATRGRRRTAPCSISRCGCGACGLSENHTKFPLAHHAYLCFFFRTGEKTRVFSLGDILAEALGLILAWDRDLSEIVVLSLRVTLSAVAIACLIGLPLGAVVGAFRFPGRGAVTVLLNTLMGLPPVVVGLFVYLMLSPRGRWVCWGCSIHPRR